MLVIGNMFTRKETHPEHRLRNTKIPRISYWILLSDTLWIFIKKLFAYEQCSFYACLHIKTYWILLSDYSKNIYKKMFLQ